MSIFFKKHQLSFLLMLLMFVFILLQPNFAFAQAGSTVLDNSPITRGLCNVFELVGGNIGKSLAIFAIVMVGFGFFTGKFSIALVIGITLGIGILFGAPKIIAALTGETAVNCSDVTEGGGVACPFEIAVNTSGRLINKKITANNSFILESLGSPLAQIECVPGSVGIRMQLTPLTTSSDIRTATIDNLFSADANIGTLNDTGIIPNSGPVELTITDFPSTGGSSLTIRGTGASFCPEIQDLPIPYDDTGGCDSGYTTIAAGHLGTAQVLCAAATDPVVATTNVTVAGTIVDKNGGGTLNIKVGFEGDKRYYVIGSSGRKLVALCDAGVWKINTDPDVASASGGAPCPATSCISSSTSPISFSLKP